jgi:hypothetical protein
VSDAHSKLDPSGAVRTSERASASYLGTRLDALRRSQNADGGWGYFPGKESWIEPTAYAALALQGDAAADRAWALLASWQNADGSFHPSAKVNVESWAASLFVTLGAARNQWTPQVKLALDWLVGSSGVESRMVNRIAASIGILKVERDISLKAWPWKPGNSGWVEPTAHAIVALKQAAAKYPAAELKERIRQGEAQLLDVRCSDGGWNYGSRAALGVDLPSYPETTALALLGLQGRSDLGKAFDLTAKMLVDTPSPMARAWLTIALRLQTGNAPEPEHPMQSDLMITAVEALAAADGNWRLMKAV